MTENYFENTKQQVEQIRDNYIPKEKTKLDELKSLNNKVEFPANIFAYSFGVIGSLVLGVGMCLAMKIIADLMPLGIVVGVVGIVMTSVNYYIYKAILKSRRKKYADKILALSNELLNK